MKQDQAIMYNALYQEVKLAIANISALGFDMSEYSDTLKNINNNVKSNVKANYVSGMAEASYIGFYTTGIKELNILKNRIEKFNVYVKSSNIVDFIELKLNGDLTPVELSGFVSKLIYVLDSINKSNTIDYSSEETIIEKIYKIAYSTIKYEILLNGESQLLLYIKHNERSQDIAFFNNLVIKDIEKIDLKKESNRCIKIRFLELGENGIYSDYLDPLLIKLFLIGDNNDELKNKIIDNITKLANDIKRSNKDISLNYNTCNNKESIIESNKDDIRLHRRWILNRITSIICALAVTTGIVIGVKKLIKKLSYVPFYDKTITTYSTKDGKTTTEVERDSYSNAEKTMKVFDYTETDRRNRHTFYIYDFRDENFESVEECYDYFVNAKNLSPNYTYRERVEEPSDAYTKVIFEEYEYIEHNYDDYYKDVYYFLAFLICGISLVVLETSYKINRSEYNMSFLITKIKGIIRDLKEIQASKRTIKDKSAEIKILVDKLAEEINQNAVLKELFIKQFAENKFLLDNPQELLDKVNSLDEDTITDVKKMLHR